MIRTFTAAEVSSSYRVPLGTVYRLASTDQWRRSVDGKWPVLYNGDDVEATMRRRMTRKAIVEAYVATCQERTAAFLAERYPNDDVERFRPAHEHDAAIFADALLKARPSLAEIEGVEAVQLVFLVSNFVHDPHDWDEVGTVLALLDYISTRRELIAT